jgi:integrase
MLPEQHRDKFLTATETLALVRALDDEPCREAALALALLILIGAKKQEVLRARWEFVDLDRGVLTVPLSKSGRPRHVPLSPAAVRVLEGQVRRRVSGNPFVFPSRVLEGKPLQGLRKPSEKAKKASGLPVDLRIHDLRHSLASALANERYRHHDRCASSFTMAPATPPPPRDRNRSPEPAAHRCNTHPVPASSSARRIRKAHRGRRESSPSW